MRQPSLRVIAALIAADPGSLEVKDGLGRLALHNAVRYKAGFQIISVLISAAPRAVHVKADDGSLPLHLACLYGGWVDLSVVQYLLWVNPESVRIPDGHGLLPKELASDNPSGCSIESIEMLEIAEQKLEKLERNDRNADGGAWRLLSKLDTMYPISFEVETCETFGSNGSESAKSETKLCVVCMERDVSRVMVPCGHPCLCNVCSTEHGLDKMHWRCPECRANVREVVKFYGRILLDE